MDQTEHLIEQVEGLGLPKYFYDLSGGELMTIPWWQKLAEAYLQTGKEVSINTNGTLIDAQVIAIFKKWNIVYPNQLFLSISLDSHDAGVNAISRPGDKTNQAICSMRALTAQGIRYRVAVTLTSRNIDSIEDTIRYIVGNLSREFIIGVLRPTFDQAKNGNLLVSYEDTLGVMKKVLALKEELGEFEMYHCFNEKCETFCAAGRDRICILPNGDVTSCYALQTNDQIVGNLFKEPLRSIFSKLQKLHINRDSSVLLCEHQHAHYGVPRYYLGKPQAP
jgi:MoaA/NifB/PqqE/SkfB family radical SAM enzyme